MATTSQQVEASIELVLPADTRFVRLARLVVSGVGAAVGFDIDEIEQLRVAVQEGCAALIEGGDGSPLLLSFELEDDGVVVLGTTGAQLGTTGVAPDRLLLSEQILSAVADDHELIHDHGRTSFRLHKRGTRVDWPLT